MPTISQLRQRRHQSQRRQTLLRIGMVVGALSLIGLAMTVMHSCFSLSTQTKNYHNAMSRSHVLLRSGSSTSNNQQNRVLLETQRQAKHSSHNKDGDDKKTESKHKKSAAQDDKTETTSTESSISTTTQPEPEDTQDGTFDDEDPKDEEIVEEIDEEEDALDAGDGADGEELAAETTTAQESSTTTTTAATTTAATTMASSIMAATTTAKTKKIKTEETSTTEASTTMDTTTTEATTTEATTTTSTATDESSATETSANADDDDDYYDDGEEYTSTDDYWDDVADGSDAAEDIDSPEKTPQETFDEEAKKEETEQMDTVEGNDLGPTDPIELALPELESRTYYFQFGHLVPPKGGSRQGTVKIVTHPEWAPIGVKHFHELVEDGYYRHCSVFRVLPNFIAQFGINPDPVITAEAEKVVLKDDPVMQTNARGTLSYATSGPNSRTTQLFFNLREEGNDFLDNKGFAPFAEVADGMEILDQIFAVSAWLNE